LDSFNEWPLVWLLVDGPNENNCIGGLMFSMLASCVEDCGLKPQSGQPKDFKISMCCFPDKHAALEGAKTGCLWIRTMCQSEVTCLTAGAGTVKNN
jgi:hypothetical protein